MARAGDGTITSSYHHFKWLHSLGIVNTLRCHCLVTVRVQATNDDNAVQCWLRLEQDVCARKLVALQAHLRAVCSEYSIELTTEKKEYHFKFPHQRKALKIPKADICTALAAHGFPLLDPDDDDPIEGNIGVAAWIARARAVQDADDKDEREKMPQEHDPAVHNKMKRGRSGK